MSSWVQNVDAATLSAGLRVGRLVQAVALVGGAPGALGTLLARHQVTAAR